MMQAADAGYSHALGGPAGPAFDHPGVRRLLLQGIVNAIVVVILEIISNQPAEMGFVEDDHVVQQFPPTTSHPTLRHAVLPGTAIGPSDQLTAKVFQHRRHLSVELAVAVEYQILGCTIFGKGLSQLLHDPGTGGMFGDVEVQDFATGVRDYEKAVQYPEGRGGHGGKVHGGDGLTMVLEKGEPALAGVSRRGPLRQVVGDRGLGDFESQFQELAVDPRTAPGRILRRHRPDEIAKLGGDFWSAGTTRRKEA